MSFCKISPRTNTGLINYIITGYAINKQII